MQPLEILKERAQYLSTTRAMETKFAQLIKLRRLLQAGEELFSLPLPFVCQKSMNMCSKVVFLGKIFGMVKFEVKAL